MVRCRSQAAATTAAKPIRYAMCAALVPGAKTDTEPATAAKTGTAAAGTRLMGPLSVRGAPGEEDQRSDVTDASQVKVAYPSFVLLTRTPEDARPTAPPRRVAGLFVALA